MHQLIVNKQFWLIQSCVRFLKLFFFYTCTFTWYDTVYKDFSVWWLWNKVENKVPLMFLCAFLYFWDRLFLSPFSTCKEGVWECTNLDCDGKRWHDRKTLNDCFTKITLKYLSTAYYSRWGRVFTECGRTCDNLDTCQVGYFCPEGQALHENGTCVPQETGCQCKHGDTFYDLGDTNPSDCSKLVLYIVCI